MGTPFLYDCSYVIFLRIVISTGKKYVSYIVIHIIKLQMSNLVMHMGWGHTSLFIEKHVKFGSVRILLC